MIQSNIVRSILIKKKYLKNSMDQIWCSCSLPSKILGAIYEVKWSYLWGKVISELFTIAHPHVELRYLLINDKEIKLIKLLTALKQSILLIGWSEVNIFIIFLFCVSRSRFSCKRSLIILILIICDLEGKKVTITGYQTVLAYF